MPRVQNLGFDDPIPAQVKQEKRLTIQQLLAHCPWDGLGSYTLSLSPVRKARQHSGQAASCRLSTSGAGIGTTLRLSLGGWRIRFLRAPVSRKICALLMLLVLRVREGRRGSPDRPVNFLGATTILWSSVSWGIKDQLLSASVSVGCWRPGSGRFAHSRCSGSWCKRPHVCTYDPHNLPLLL